MLFLGEGATKEGPKHFAARRNQGPVFRWDVDIFPMIQPELYEKAEDGQETATDIAMNGAEIVANGGRIETAEGAEAVKQWAWRALQTRKGVFEIFSEDYGSDIEAILEEGPRELIESEMETAIQECLMANRYIESIDEIEIGTEGERMHIRVVLSTAFGEVSVNV